MEAQLTTILALQTAVDDMPGIIPKVNIVASANGVFETEEPHGLSDDLSVVIVDHTGANGYYRVHSAAVMTFMLSDVVSGAEIVSSGTGGTVRAQLTHYEDTVFDPVMGVPYEECFIMFATPDNLTQGRGFYRLLGYLQMSLHYPRDTGMLGITQRAELYRAIFARGNSFIKDDIIVNIAKTAVIEKSIDPPDGYTTRIVKMPFWVDVFE